MLIANVVVVLAAAIVFPAVTYLGLRRLGGSMLGNLISEPRSTPFGVFAFLICCVLVIYAGGAYATRPFDSISPFMNMFLPCMLVIEIYIRRGTTRGYAVAFFWGAIVLAFIVAFVSSWIKH